MVYDIKTRWDSAYRMLARALYLRKAIDHFVDDEDDDFAMYKLTKKEWNQVAVLVSILLPFKITSQRLQATKRPAIDSVFWIYESLFNKIDALKATFNLPEYADEEWIQELHAGVEQLSIKLEKYYDKTDVPFVYPDSCLLEPKGKDILFKQQNFGGGGGRNWAEEYKRSCRNRYIRQYEPRETSNQSLGKHPREETDSDEDDPDDYRTFLNKRYQAATAANEFDIHMSSPPANGKVETLTYWKSRSDLRHLQFMARDTYAVPATGAGVERIFSKSGRVATWTRARLNAATIRETMLYKDFLVREGNPLNEELEKTLRARRKKGRKNKEPVTTEAGESEDEEDEEDEEDPTLIKWEREWWAKEDAIIIT